MCSVRLVYMTINEHKHHSLSLFGLITMTLLVFHASHCSHLIHDFVDNNQDRWNWNCSLPCSCFGTSRGMSLGPFFPPRVPHRPSFSASVKVPGTGEVPGLIVDPPRLPVEQSLLCHRPSILSHYSLIVATLSSVPREIQLEHLF